MSYAAGTVQLRDGRCVEWQHVASTGRLTRLQVCVTQHKPHVRCMYTVKGEAQGK